MELNFLSFPALLTFILFFITAFKLKTKSKNSNQNLPPGPSKMPFFGNIHNLAGSLPHRKLRDLAKKYGSLMHLQLGELSMIVVSSPETAKEIMKTHDVIFAQRPNSLAARILTYNGRTIALAPYGDYWRQMRKICISELLSAKRVQSFRSIREEEVSKMINSMFSKAGEVINLREMISTLTNVILCRAAFGEKCRDQREFLSTVSEVMDATGGFSVADTFPSLTWLHMLSGERSRLEKTHRKIDKMLEDIIGVHKASKERRERGDSEAEEDLVDVLLRIQEEDTLAIPLTIENIKAVVSDMFIAGIESSATTIEWAMSELLKAPTALKKAQAEVRQTFAQNKNVNETCLDELNYLELVIKETLRLHPPAPLLIPRESREDCTINGYAIPAKTRIIVNAWAIGRDPNSWKEAEKFIPERFLERSIDYKGTNFEYIPFGAGRRICPGITFGMANVLLPLAHMLYHFDWKLPNGAQGEDLDMDERFGSAVRRKRDLRVVPIVQNVP